MAIKKDIVYSAVNWWFENIFKQNIFSVDDYFDSRDNWLKSQGVSDVVRNGELLETIPLNIKSDSDDCWGFTTEEEEILFVLRWKNN